MLRACFESRYCTQVDHWKNATAQNKGTAAIEKLMSLRLSPNKAYVFLLLLLQWLHFRDLRTEYVNIQQFIPVPKYPTGKDREKCKNSYKVWVIQP
jgi:hypothetical protein